MRLVEAYITYIVNNISRKNLKSYTAELQEVTSYPTLDSRPSRTTISLPRPRPPAPAFLPFPRTEADGRLNVVVVY